MIMMVAHWFGIMLPGECMSLGGGGGWGVGDLVHLY